MHLSWPARNPALHKMNQDGVGLPEYRTIARLTTDANGRFDCEVSANYGLIVARKFGYAVACAEYAEQLSDPFSIVLTAPESVTGKVIDEAGKPVAGAEVFATEVHTGQSRQGLPWRLFILFHQMAFEYFRTVSGDDGSFRLASFPTNASVALAARVRGKSTPWNREAMLGPTGVRHVATRAGDRHEVVHCPMDSTTTMVELRVLLELKDLA